MPDDVQAALRKDGVLRVTALMREHRQAAPRALAHIASWRGLEGAFADGQLRSPCVSPAVPRPARLPARKSDQALTVDVIDELLRTCWMNRPIDVRDRAILLVAFGSGAGGDPRWPVCGSRMSVLSRTCPLARMRSRFLQPSLQLGRTKTTDATEGAIAWLVGKPVEALKAWLSWPGSKGGPLFRPIDQWGHIGQGALSPQAVNLIVKKRVALAGLDPRLYSAHGLRSGYLTEAARQGVPLTEAMAQSHHRSVQQAARYYNDVERKMGQAARLLG